MSASRPAKTPPYRTSGSEDYPTLTEAAKRNSLSPFMSVGDLRAALEGVSDDTQIVVSGGLEQEGIVRAWASRLIPWSHDCTDAPEDHRPGRDCPVVQTFEIHTETASDADAFPHLSQTCWCHMCDGEAVRALPAGDMRRIMRRMSLCPECGNKRCPRSTWHDNPCSGSNEPGQQGSIYGIADDLDRLRAQFAAIKSEDSSLVTQSDGNDHSSVQS